MIKKCIILISSIFMINSAIAETSHSDHMSEMMHGDKDAHNVMGAFSLKANLWDARDFSYEAYVAWKGSVNQNMHWVFSIGTDLDQKFESSSLVSTLLREAYVFYMPFDNFKFVLGKSKVGTSGFNTSGVLYESDRYTEGAMLSYLVGDEDNLQQSSGLTLYSENNQSVLIAELGLKYVATDNVQTHFFVTTYYDGFDALMMTEDENLFEDQRATVTLSAKVSTLNMMYPVGIFGNYIVNVTDFSTEMLQELHSFQAGIYVGKASTSRSGKRNDCGLSISYFDLDSNDVVADYLETSYLAKAGKGVAVRAQHNVLDNVNVIVKYARNLDTDSNMLSAEMNLLF